MAVVRSRARISARASSVHSILSAILFERKILQRQAELGEDIFVRDAAAAAFLEPGIGARERLFFLNCERLVVNRSRSQGAEHGIEQHELEKAYGCCDLPLLQPVYQLVGVFFVGNLLHGSSCCAQRIDAPFRKVSIVRSNTVCLTGDSVSICSSRRNTLRLGLPPVLSFALSGFNSSSMVTSSAVAKRTAISADSFKRSRSMAETMF